MKLLTQTMLACFAVAARAHCGLNVIVTESGEKMTPWEEMGLSEQDSYRFPLSPGRPHSFKACHGVKKDAPALNGRTNTPMRKVNVGDKLTVELTSKCAGHGGGHCAMLVSVDEVKWYKIADAVDCNTVGGAKDVFGTVVSPPKANGGGVIMPAGVPKECAGAKGCALATVWTPMNSGNCEIYMDCYRIQVPQATGGIESVTERTLNFPLTQCARPAGNTHLTTHYGKVFPEQYKGGEAAAKTTQAPIKPIPVPTVKPDGGSAVTDGCASPKTCEIPTCTNGDELFATNLPATHTVVGGDTLTDILLEYDLQIHDDDGKPDDINNIDRLFNINKCNDNRQKLAKCYDTPAENKAKVLCMTDKDQICIGQELHLPAVSCGQGSGGTKCLNGGMWIGDMCYCPEGFQGGDTCEVTQTRGNGSAATTLAAAALVASIFAQT